MACCGKEEGPPEQREDVEGRKVLDAWIGSKSCRVMEGREGSLCQEIEISE